MSASSSSKFTALFTLVLFHRGFIQILRNLCLGSKKLLGKGVVSNKIKPKIMKEIEFCY